MRFALLIIAAAGCQSYQPGSFSHARDARAARATAGCLDVAVERRWDAAATGPVVRIAVANRCDRAVEVDLGAIRARGSAPGGVAIAHVAFDPRGEIRPALLDGRSVAAEVIEYRAAEPGPPPSALCLDLSEMTPAQRSVEPVCVAAGAAIAGVDR